MRVLGLGYTTFGPGRDGGRDGYYEGEAPYPSEADRWSGTWYLQAKFHAPHLTVDAQRWLLDQIQLELKAFATDDKRVWPDNWIVVTNVEISAVPEVGTFDRARDLVFKARPQLAQHFHLWGGNKVIGLLANYQSVAQRYAHFITPGHVLSELMHQLNDAHGSVESIVRFFIVKQLEEQQYTRLEQAGAGGEARPGIHHLFIDLPFLAREYNTAGMLAKQLLKAAAHPHRVDAEMPDTQSCRDWRRHPDRARVWFVKAGPGHGKSTVGQYLCQVARAALILSPNAPPVSSQQRELAEEIRKEAIQRELWPRVPRIPVSIDLKDYAQWYAEKHLTQPRGILTFLAERVSAAIEQPVLVGTLRRMLRCDAWFVVFDGLDEVPQDVKDAIAGEVKHVIDHVAVELSADLMSICTSRPQGYSGQFSDIDGPTVELTSLSAAQAISCARPLLRLNRTDAEFRHASALIERAIESPSVRELMTTPLQSHIMAVIVRDGGRPPDRRWQLYSKFYDVIRKREANKNFADVRLAKLLREDEQLLKTVHSRLGFLLHARAETSDGAQTHLSREEFRTLATDAVRQLVDRDVDETVSTLMAATVNRLVLVSTPDDGDHVRFDIRPLQEFFAAEFVYESVDAVELERRLAVIGGDSHWREVMHFLLSALVEGQRRTELLVAIRILEQLNGDGLEGEVRLASRRLAKGAVIAARLLSEGVLEQDRRVRAEFKRALEPILASTDLRVLQPLEVMSQPASLTWFRTVLSDICQEASPSEHVGAGWLYVELGCELDQCDNVLDLIRSMPSTYISEIIVTRDEYSSHAQSAPPTMLKARLADLLLRDRNWRCLSSSTIIAALKILRAGAAGQLIEVENRDRQMLEWITNSLTGRKGRGSTEDFGILRVTYGFDWSLAGTGRHDIALNHDSPYEFLRVVSRVVAFHRQPSSSALRDIFADITPAEFSLLPSFVQALVPIDLNLNVADQIARLMGLRDDELHVLLETGASGSVRIQRRASMVEWTGRVSQDGWKKLVGWNPAFALNIWTDPSLMMERHAKTFSSRRTAEVLVARLLRSPELLRDCPYVWGRMVKAVPDRERELRSAFLKVAQLGPPRGQGYMPFSPLHIEMPSESALVPFMLTAALTAWNSPSRDTPALPEVRDRISESIGVITRAGARKYASLPAVTRAAIQLCAIVNAGDFVHEDIEILMSAYSRLTGAWLLDTVATVTRLIAAQESEMSLRLVGRLLNAARDDFAVRGHLEPLLWWWREVSLAPVTARGVTGMWLLGAPA